MAQFSDEEYDQFLQSAMRSAGAPFVDANSARPHLLMPDRPGEHVWVLMAAYRIKTERLIEAENKVPIYMDAENLASAEIGCWTCATRWVDREDDRICPGNPHEQIMKALTDMMLPRCEGCESPLCPDCRGDVA